MLIFSLYSRMLCNLLVCVQHRKKNICWGSWLNTQANFNRFFDSKLENCLLLIKALTEDMKFFIYSVRGFKVEHGETSSNRSNYSHLRWCLICPFSPGQMLCFHGKTGGKQHMPVLQLQLQRPALSCKHPKHRHIFSCWLCCRRARPQQK